MAALVQALDNYTPTQLGENGHSEYGWSNSIQENIVQLNFQITRCKEDSSLDKLKFALVRLLQTLKTNYEKMDFERNMWKHFLVLMYKMIGQTRDIVDGKGEYTLTYMLIHTWYDFFPDLALFFLECCVRMPDNEHPYGSWKDIKYFCSYCREHGASADHPLIKHATSILNAQIRSDQDSLSQGKNVNVSLAAKWVPREKSKRFGWLFQELAVEYFSYYLETVHDDQSRKRAINKAKMSYRKIVSALNKNLDTLQIKQCSNRWSHIDFNNVTSISMTKQTKAFQNKIGVKNTIRYPDREDRICCAKNFELFIRNKLNNNENIKGKRVGMTDFVKQALSMYNHESIDCDILNSQWKDNSSLTGQLGKMIAMVDVSGSMSGDPMHAAIGLGIRVAEKSILGKRVMTFSSAPSWVNLEDTSDFVSMVHKVRQAPWGMNTNFHAALDLILNAIIDAKMTPEDVQDMVLVIFSDMQIDEADSNYKSLYDNIKLKYEQTGIRLHGRAFKPPHILFWNLRSTSGFPTLANETNTSMMSGFSPALLNSFCEEGIDSLLSFTPWRMLEKNLSNKRYQILEDKANSIL